MRASFHRKIWFLIMAALSVLGWVALLSPWAEWAPAGVRWPSMLVALLFGLTAFFSISYYPLFVAVVTVPLAFGLLPRGRSNFRNPLFLYGAVFLAGFAGIFALQSMVIMPVKAHGAGGSLWSGRTAAGVFVFSGLVAIAFSLKKTSSWNKGTSNCPVIFKILVFLLGLGWGVYYGHDLDPAYDRMHFRVGAGPGSHEAPALILFGAGLIGLQALWAWGIDLWLGDVLDRAWIRLVAGLVLVLSGVIMMTDVHLF